MIKYILKTNKNRKNPNPSSIEIYDLKWSTHSTLLSISLVQQIKTWLDKLQPTKLLRISAFTFVFLFFFFLFLIKRIP